MKKISVFLILFVLLTLLFLLTGCNKIKPIIDTNIPPSTINDIAYDYNDTHGYRIYLEENNKYVPFLVLTNDYNGNCLLVREHILDESVPYITTTSNYNSYYENCNIDKYLNQKYISRFSSNLKNLILKSDIEICSKEAIDTHDDIKNIIKRKIFLLSLREINTTIGFKEGEPLDYFKGVQNKIATYADGEPASWILRTPALSSSSTVYGIDWTGSIGMGGLNGPDGPYECGIRPAFCIPCDTKIILRDDIISGESVYCIDFEN